jgi:hypothetical protein
LLRFEDVSRFAYKLLMPKTSGFCLLKLSSTTNAQKPLNRYAINRTAFIIMFVDCECRRRRISRVETSPDFSMGYKGQLPRQHFSSPKSTEFVYSMHFLPLCVVAGYVAAAVTTKLLPKDKYYACPENQNFDYARIKGILESYKPVTENATISGCPDTHLLYVSLHIVTD